MPGPSDQGLDVSDLVALMVPQVEPSVRDAAITAVGEPRVRDLAAVRRMLAVIDDHLTPSPVVVRLGSEDVAYAELGDLNLAVDVADGAVSRTILAQAYEPHLTAVFRDYCRPGMTVVDVGANVGYYSLLSSRLVGEAGRVIAVEASSENCRLLLVSLAINGASNVELLPVAAAEGRGWSYFARNLGSNGAFLPNSGEDLLARPGVVVPTFPLDELVEGPVNLIKLDVEGAEGRVVRGARRLIEEYRPVVATEFMPGMLPVMSGCSATEYLGWFLELGYDIVLLERESGRRVEVARPEELLTPGDRLDDLLLLPPGW
jgi:FkbM family methyltransferase